MFRTVPLSINRSFLLYTQQWYMSYRFADTTNREQKTYVVIQQNSRKLLMMDILMSETC